MKYFLFLILNFVLIKLSFRQNNCTSASSQAILDINQVNTTVLGGGDLWWDLNNAKYEVPKDSGINSIFAGALWIGGIDDGGQLRLAAQTYRYSGNDYFPGPGQYKYNCEIFDRHWSITRSEIDKHISTYDIFGPNIPLTSIPSVIKEWPAKGNTITKNTTSGIQTVYISDDLAPFIDIDNDGFYDASKGDYPDVPGDQAIWWVYNDYNYPHSESGGLPLNIDVQMLAYAYKTPGIIDFTTFYKYKIIYRGNNKISDVHIGQWTDTEIGYAFNDYVGCDTMRNLGIGYNSEPLAAAIAQRLGTNSPIVGVKFLKTSINDQGVRPGMTKFMFYNNDFSVIGNPVTPLHYYNYLTGKWKNDSLWKYYPDVGQPFPINYMVPGKPGKSWWNECNEEHYSGDRRFLMSSGPYTFNPGTVLELDFAVIWKACPDQVDCFADFDCIGLAADTVQTFFDNIITTGVHEKHIEKGQINIYPNPADNIVNIDCTACTSSKEIRIEITDISGRLQRTDIFHGNNNFSVERENLPPGVYFISVFTDDLNIGNKKIIFK